MSFEDDTKEIWFPAKRYGWGWGLPCRWQGWVFLLLWMAAMIPGAIWLTDSGRTGCFIVFEISMIVLLVAVGWWKGEKPHWRWGK